MAELAEKRRISNSYFSVVVSIALVLFMLGLVSLILLQAKELSDYVKENIRISVYLHDDVKEVDIRRLQKSLDASVYVSSTEYVDKDEAASIMEAELGEDFVSFLGENPLMNSIDLHLEASYVHPDSVAWIEADLLKNPKVEEVYYQKSLLTAVNENVRKISFVLIGFASLLLIVAVALINNTIRLAIYSRRFIIRSMQLVGATQGFIRRPFIMKGIRHGLYGALIATTLLAGVIYYAQEQMPTIFDASDIQVFASLFGVVMALGIIISWFSTNLAVRKYLRLSTDQLYN